MAQAADSLILIDPDERRSVLARRLRAQGFAVDVYADPAEGANAALASPPDAVVADLWMPGISGVQIARLLGSEPATMDVPVLLRSTTDEPRTRFWARHAGAAGYVAKGRMGELVRALRRVIQPRGETFFQHLGRSVDVRDRVSAHLDRALFESVLASELRALGSAGSFDRLMDLFSQLMVQVTSYRWLAVWTRSGRLGIHCRPETRSVALLEATAALVTPDDGRPEIVWVEDDDAGDGAEPGPLLRAEIQFARIGIGRLALSACPGSDADQALVDLVARELGGSLRMVDLVEETQRLATTDALTGLLRRPPFVERCQEWHAERPRPSVGLLLLDLDRFKHINDRFGHAGGDLVLAATGRVLAQTALRTHGLAARWGGEEFVLALRSTARDQLAEVAEQIREQLAAQEITSAEGHPIAVTASIGAAIREEDETLESWVDRADRAMYVAKSTGRDRVVAAWAVDLDQIAGRRLGVEVNGRTTPMSLDGRVVAAR